MKKTIIYEEIKFYRIEMFPDYYVSRCGKILSTIKYRGTSLRILKANLNSDGYRQVRIFGKQYKVHRITSKQFLINYEDKEEVNHKNGIRHDNNIENLEWSTKKENQVHSWKKLNRVGTFKGKFDAAHNRSKKVKQLSLSGSLIKNWDSLSEAARQLKINRGNISNCCYGVVKQVGGFRWKY